MWTNIYSDGRDDNYSGCKTDNLCSSYYVGDYVVVAFSANKNLIHIYVGLLVKQDSRAISESEDYIHGNEEDVSAAQTLVLGFELSLRKYLKR